MRRVSYRYDYELGETLVTAIEAAEVRDPDSEDEQVAELQSKLAALDLD